MASVFDQNDTPQLSHIATDGETYGHQHKFGDMALAYCLHHIQQNDLAKLTKVGATIISAFKVLFLALISSNNATLSFWVLCIFQLPATIFFLIILKILKF
jgi:hypothetical protein